MGRFKAPQPPLQRPGEGALLMPEQFGGEERRRNRCAVHANKRPGRTLRPLVNGARDEFLSRSGLTQDENCGIRWCHFCDLHQYLAQWFRRPNDFLKHRRASDLLAQRQVLVSNSLFSLFAVLDIGPRGIPANGVSRFVSQRVVVNQEPAILTIPAADSSFVLE